MAQTSASRLAWPLEKESPAKRPETKEGGREEEEKRLGIAAATMDGRLRSAKNRERIALALIAALAAWIGRKIGKFRRIVCMAWLPGCPDENDRKDKCLLLGFIVTDQSQKNQEAPNQSHLVSGGNGRCGARRRNGGARRLC